MGEVKNPSILQKIINCIDRYNKYIKSKGKRFYIFLLVFTTILQSVALSVIPSVIDNSWDNTFKLFIVMIMLFSVINIRRYREFENL